MTNPALQKAITAKASYRGATYGARGDITVADIRTALDFTEIARGRTRRITSLVGYRITVPVLCAVSTILPLYSYFSKLRIGRVLGPVPLEVTAIDNSSTDALTITAHGLSTGDAVTLGWDEAAPTLSSGSLSRTTTYYAQAIDADTITLHPTANDASNNTATVNFTSSVGGSTGKDLTVFRQFPLVVTRSSGVAQTFTNAVVEALPDLVMSGGALTLEGNLVLRALPALGAVPDGTDSAQFYTETAAAWSPPSWDNSARLTQPPTAAWGASAPWSAFQSAGGFRASVALQMEDINNGVWPGAALKYNGAQPTVRATPMGITPAELAAATNKDLGAIQDGEDLVITATGLVFTLVQGILQPATHNYHPSNALVPELTWAGGGDDDGTQNLRAPFLISSGS